ncbi:hypothetical protein DH2020_045120 [Rehmannia glutinosa]|uniref:glutathione transferase n=1 Tax=Rehmannia glutinosa TaxID=99300 RepID=A0ABR0UF17_REHGL
MSKFEKVKLLGTGVSPFEWRIIWALKVKGIEFEFIKEDVSNKSLLLLEKNPVYKMIPVLIHGQNAISESLIILEYIDETWKDNPILPKDPAERAYSRFWAKFSEEKIVEPSRLAFHYTGDKQAEGVKLMANGLQILESQIKGKKFFGGDEIGYLDIVIGWIAYWLHFSQEAGDYKGLELVQVTLGRVEKVKLLGTGVSPFKWRIIWALKLKGIEFEFIKDVSNKSLLLLEKNPVYKMIPVLIHGQNAISESLVILEYIDETWKQNPILPKDPAERAYSRFWAKFSEEKIVEPIKLAFHYTGEKQAKGFKLLEEGLDILEGQIKGKKFFGGNEIGYLDIVVGWIAYWLHFNQEAAGYKVMDQAKYPGIDQWMKNFLQVDIIKENLPPFDEMMSNYKMYRKMSLAVLNVTQ